MPRKVIRFFLFGLELNRFTINSINHNHYDNTSRIALDDETNEPWPYWLRSAGVGFEWDADFRPVAIVWTNGYRSVIAANNTVFGFRPSFIVYVIYLLKYP